MNLGFDHPDLAPYQDGPDIRALKRRCPLCRAKPGKDCVSASGKPVQGWRMWSNDYTSWVRYPGIHSARMKRIDWKVSK